MSKNILSIVLGKARQSFKGMILHPKLLFLAMLCDALFFFAYGFVRAPIYHKLSEYIVIIGSVLSESAASMARGNSQTMSSIIANDPAASGYFNSLLLLYALLGFSVYLVYTFFHSVSWKLSYDIRGNKIGMYKFMKEFASLTLFWFVIFIIYYFIDFFAELRQAALQSIGVESQNLLGGVMLFFLIAIFYFGMISYTIIGKGTTFGKVKKSFYIGVKKAHYIIPVYAVIAVVFFVLDYILGRIGAVNLYAMIIIGLLTMVPALTWARVYLSVVVEKALKSR